MHIMRRSLLKALAASVVGSSYALPAVATPAVSSGRARYVVQVLLHGGIDGVFTIDPKTRHQVDGAVDVPYGPNQIVQAGGLRLGPHMAAMKGVAPFLTIVNGVHVDTANHESGTLNATRMRTGACDEMPSLLEIIASRQVDTAASLVTLGVYFARFGVQGGIHSNTLKAVDRSSPDDLRLLAQTLRSQGAELNSLARQVPNPRSDTTRRSLEESARFLERCSDVPAFRPDPGWVTANPDAAEASRGFQRILWLLENDMSQCVYLVLRNWDTHYANAKRQTSKSNAVVPVVARFLEELGKRSNRHGSLRANTLFVMSSEIGRLPFVNAMMGKDHFPEIGLVLSGPGLNTNGGKGAQFGQTGRMMEALPISLATGLPAAGGVKPTLTDVGTTLLRHVGFDPSTWGYHGRTLDFVGV